MTDLQHLRSLADACALDVTVGAPEQIVSCRVRSTGLPLVLAMGPGSSVVASTLLPTPPVAEEDLAGMTAQLQARIPHARVHLRRPPGGGNVAYFDDFHAFDPAVPIDADWLRGSVQSLERAARASRLFGEPLEDSDALISVFSADDAARHETLKQILKSEGFSFSEVPRLLGGAAVVIDDEVGMRIMVRDGTLLFHVAVPFPEPFEVRAAFAAAVHAQLPFGRVLVGPPESDVIVVEYPHRVGSTLTVFDVVHGFAAMSAVSEVMAGDDDGDTDGNVS